MTPPARGELTVRVRYDECDPMGVVHHAVYPIWFEMGRTELLRPLGLSYRDLEADGVFLAVTKLAIRYRAAARYDDELVVHTTLTRATRVKLEHAYELRRDGRLLAEGETTIACLDGAGRVRVLPEVLGGRG